MCLCKVFASKNGFFVYAPKKIFQMASEHGSQHVRSFAAAQAKGGMLARPIWKMFFGANTQKRFFGTQHE